MFFNRISLEFVHKGLVNNKSALVQSMTWRQAGDKPLPELMLTGLTDAYMRHYGEMSQLTGWFGTQIYFIARVR